MIATLSDCPARLSIDECKNLEVLPFGQKIIHLNILQQLPVPTLDFAKVEAQCLISQIIHQVGPSDSRIERASQHMLTKAAFGHAMIDQLEASLQRPAEN